MKEPILVCGASGQIGGFLRGALDAAGAPWIGLSRRPAPAGAGGQWRTADFERPASLGPALEGVRAVFLAMSDHPRQDELEIAMIQTCRERGVERVVKLSAQSAGLDPPVSFGALHARSEQALRESGMAWTLLRPVFFMQSLLFFAASIRGGKLIAPTGRGEVTFVDGRDVAAVAAAALVRPAEHENRVHTLTGSRALSFQSVAELLSNATGRSVRHISPPRWLARAVLPWVSGMPRWQSNRVVELMSAIAAGAQSVPTGTIAEVTRSEPRSIERFIEEHRVAFGAR